MHARIPFGIPADNWDRRENRLWPFCGPWLHFGRDQSSTEVSKGQNMETCQRKISTGSLGLISYLAWLSIVLSISTLLFFVEIGSSPEIKRGQSMKALLTQWFQSCVSMDWPHIWYDDEPHWVEYLVCVMWTFYHSSVPFAHIVITSRPQTGLRHQIHMVFLNSDWIKCIIHQSMESTDLHCILKWLCPPFLFVKAFKLPVQCWLLRVIP